jgi:NDP-sugar pyrophosphorylase family protein
LTKVKDPSQYGVAKLEGKKILEFVEKPKKEEAPSNLINSGLYIIEPEVIDMIPNGFAMLEKSVFPKLAEQGKLFGYPFSGQWFDTGNIKRYNNALKEWKGLV